MATLSNIANKKNALSGDNSSTGQLGYNLVFGTPSHIIRMTKGTIIPAATVFNKAYIDGQTKAGVFTPIIGADTFVESSSEDSMNSNTKGIERLSVDGLPKYEFTYEQGNEFYKQLSKLKSFKEAEFMLGDEDGNWKLAVNSDGDYVGFSAGQVLPKLSKAKIQGGEPESKTLSIQFLNRQQWDLNYAIIEQANLDFTPEEIGVVNPVHMSITIIPSNTDTTLTFSAMLAADNSTPVLGLVSADIQVKVNGAVVSNALSETGLGIYVATIAAMSTGQVVSVGMISTSVDTSIVLSGDLYRSDTASETVIV